METIEQILKDIGLSEKETKVYLALLGLGEETASRISEIANLNRVTTYTLLKSLKEKGFCSIFDKNKVQYFKPIKPEEILGLIEEKKMKINSIIPLLKEKEKETQEKPEVSLFEGQKGISSMLNIILNDADTKKEAFGYGNLTISEKVIEYASINWRKTRIARGIKMRAVIDSLKGFEAKKDKKWQKLSQARINKELEKINAYVLITENLVGYYSFKGDIVGVLIKNKEIAEKEKFNFEMLWKSAR
jgi:sugar-specific transcriptional regulator TrmB